MTKGRISFLIIIFSCLLFIPFLGSVHLFDWDEVNFAECAREMLITKNYFNVTINFLPFWEKPPLFIWMQAISMNIFGVNEFAARLPNAICGIVTLLVLFHIGTKIKSQLFGLIWILVYAGSIMPQFYFKSGIIDPWFNLFIFLGVYFFSLHTYDLTGEVKTKNKTIYLSALFIGLAILTKGPVAFLIYLLCVAVYWIQNRFKNIISVKQFSLSAIIVTAIAGIWFIAELINDFSVIERFFLYQVRLLTTEDAGHGGPWFFHLIVLFFGCFPASVFALQGFKKNASELGMQQHFKKIMTILFFVVLILFSIVKTKIIHYSSLAWFPLTYLAAYTIEKIISGEYAWKKYVSWIIGTIGILLGIILSSPILIDKYKNEIIASNIIDDKFAVANLEATVIWTQIDVLPGIILIAGTIFILMMVKRKEYKKGLFGLFVASLLAVNLFSILAVPKIEKYSQGAAIEFYENLSEQDCYVTPLGFFSYAHLYYFNKMPQTNLNSNNTDWLLTGDTDKPVYVVCKIIHEEEFKKQYPQLKELYRKNGFVFFKREKK